jgi:hypothetical protein
MISEDDHPEMIKAQQELLRRLGKVLGNGRNALTKPFLDRLFGVIKDHRAAYRIKGVDFPVMVALVVPRLGIVEFARADLDIASLRIKIVNFVRFNPNATMEEVVQAFRMAYPDLKPDEVLTGHTAGIQANERRDARTKKVVEEFLGRPEDEPGELD